MSSQDRIPAIESAKLLNSLRASDFDIPSAIGELIDNAIQAEADVIHLKIEDITQYGQRGRPYKLIDKIICADNGYGMPCETNGILHSCIKLGYSTRYNDRKGIGRFGVGMTLAGIRYATKIEVYSKYKGGEWYFVEFDLNNDEDLNQGIKPPVRKDVPEDYRGLCGKDQGTIVIWSGFDKYAEQELHATTYDDKLKENSLDPYGYLNYWIGRTFRKFIWKGVSIYLNEKEVYSFDPLYLNKEKNLFPDDPAAEVYREIEIPWTISPSLRNDSRDETEDPKIKITITKLPAEFRQERGKGGLPFYGRYIALNEGISIVRASREVFYDLIPRLQKDNNNKINWEERDRWWGCEISFNPELDEYFAVKNIKRGAVPVKELREAIYMHLHKPRKDIIDEVSEHWKKQDLVKSTPEGEVKGRTPLHSPVEDIVKSVRPMGTIKAGTNLSEEERSKRTLEATRGLDETESVMFEGIFKAQPFSVREDSWRGDQFIEYTYIEGHAALQYNVSHLFFEELSTIRKQLQNGAVQDDASIIAKKLNDMVDILLMSYVMARSGYADDAEYTVDEIMGEITTNWGRYLKRYTKAYLDQVSGE